MQGSEIRPTTVVANAQFAVQDGRDCRKLHEGLRKAGQAICPFSTAFREQPDVIAILRNQQAIPIPFRLMRPALPHRGTGRQGYTKLVARTVDTPKIGTPAGGAQSAPAHTILPLYLRP